ncbi:MULTISPECIES: sulfotransferase family 2 domain-containing protein [Bacillus]|mgnify:CR=1 FL=1|nr:sulfotransferase family 2 domain-containing protein [Bacillus thuringiensis]MCU5454759.1 sulfotransferase family 2 domain-containing protein [Bacillus cereus]MCU5548962.1 sulfotransferase family 2 domain-containing protein [Bacillus cereus]MCU5680057.1 sulfotransferase family 2 domain-containing protein [Bacillus cereus]PDZ89189.1 RNA methyltransferase [Bacillus thuringiensis]HDR6388564.1 sulfotransferase family 2 domain-containing protein [Bacillus cereus]
MTMTDIYNFMIKHGRMPHFHDEFPLILFWSQKSGCTSLANWFFYQIGLYEEAINYEPFIHNYEYDIYKNSFLYYIQVATELRLKEKQAYKLVRNPYKRAVSSFLSLLSLPHIEHPEWRPIRQFLYGDENCNKKISFKLYLYYLKSFDSNSDLINPHYAPQYIQGEEHFVTNYIYLENYSSAITKLEDQYELKKSPLDLLEKSWHHQSDYATFTGDYTDADITDPLFPRIPTYDSFYDHETIQLVQDIFNKDFITYKYPLTPLKNK